MSSRQEYHLSGWHPLWRIPAPESVLCRLSTWRMLGVSGEAGVVLGTELGVSGEAGATLGAALGISDDG